MALRPKRRLQIERYSLDQSPLSHALTKRKLSQLIRVSLSELNGLVKYKHAFITERTEGEGGKARPLLYPTGQLRRVNEKLLFQFRKMKLPEYVISPRKGRSQRDNAQAHIEGRQILKIDIVKFYPSVGRESIAAYMRNEFNMYTDVAGLITELVSAKGRIFYGSPLTPLLVFLIYQEMFDQINAACKRYGVTMTLWVDNLFLSGDRVPGTLLKEIREIICQNGFRSHDVAYEHTNRVVPITGVGVRKGELLPSNALNLAIRDLERQLRQAKSVDEYDDLSQRLLSKLGSAKYIYGSHTARGRKVAARMNAIRQKRRSKLLNS